MSVEMQIGALRAGIREHLRSRAASVVDPLEVGRSRSELVVRSRVVLHLVLRPVARLLLASAMASTSRVRSRRRVAVALAAAGIVWDAVEGWRLAKSGRVRTAERMLVDAADMALWTAQLQMPSGNAAVLGAPLT